MNFVICVILENCTIWKMSMWWNFFHFLKFQQWSKKCMIFNCFFHVVEFKLWKCSLEMWKDVELLNTGVELFTLRKWKKWFWHYYLFKLWHVFFVLKCCMSRFSMFCFSGVSIFNFVLPKKSMIFEYGIFSLIFLRW